MFTALSERLTAALKRLTGRGVLSEQDVTAALRDIRRHLLEADVSFEVAQGFAERVRERAIGAIAVKAAATMDAEAAQRLERKARSKQGMDLADFLVALKQMLALGPIKQVLGLLPGVNAQALKAVNADCTGSQPAAGAFPADAEAFEKDVGTLWQIAFGCGGGGGRGRATSGSSSRTRALPATGGSS